MENLQIYNNVREVPQQAKKAITGGRLKGMTDINPMWRIKTLTEQFGPVGIGWYYEITDQWIEESHSDPTNNKVEKSAFCNIKLFIKVDGEWSKPIIGTGGSAFVENQKYGPYMNDECYKMALTDAISVACKALGVGANVYWEKDNTKYIDQKKDNYQQQPQQAPPKQQYANQQYNQQQSYAPQQPTQAPPQPQGQASREALHKARAGELAHMAHQKGISSGKLMQTYINETGIQIFHLEDMTIEKIEEYITRVQLTDKK